MQIGLIHFNHTEANGLTRWADLRTTSTWRPNYGDMLVCIAIMRQLQFSGSVRAAFGQAIKSKVDRSIVRGSTYLHKAFDYAAAIKTLESNDAPFAIVGLGAQNPTLDPKFLDDHAPARDFIACLNERSKSISVRGAFTADVVERLGGKNIRVTGCPSLFYQLECPTVSVPQMLRLPQRSLGVSIHSGLMKNIYCSSPNEALTMHGQSIAWAINNSANVSVFEQGVLVEYDVADRSLNFEERRASASKVIERIRASELFTPEDLMARMVSVQSIEEWLAKARDLDAIIGFRFHGNMVALLQGKPCYYYTYDSRLKEFCDLYGLPSQSVTEPFVDPAQAMIEHDWDETGKRIASLYAELRGFYEENGFVTHLPAGSPEAAN